MLNDLAVMIEYGLVSGNADKMQVFVIEGKLIRDEFFTKRRVELAQKKGSSCFDEFSSAIKSLTPTELLDLRERICGNVIKIKK
jgi:hypothetical protein